MSIAITAPLDDVTVTSLKAGDIVCLSGVIYTARDAAHKRLIEMLEAGEKLPFEPEGQIIYYVGPCPTKPGQVIGSAGPTTSGRMDKYAPALMDIGIKGMIGKGIRSETVINSIIQNKAVYLAAIGGAGALLAESVRAAEVIAFPELGAEAIYKLTVDSFPAIVVIDSRGENLYETGKAKYRRG